MYYADSSVFCFASTPIPGCDLALNEYACNECDVGDIADMTDKRIWTRCSALRMPPDAPVSYDHDQCVTHSLLYRPVLSLMRDACSCYRPEAAAVTMYSVSANDELEHIDDLILFEDEQKDTTLDSDCHANRVYLRNEDFMAGTVRISECGEYVLAEDIVLDFNPPNMDEMSDDNFSPNGIDGEELFWFPTRQQSLDDAAYPGLYSFAGSYSLGFFAAITVEADNVKLNLNGFSMSMAYPFYLQQRFFTLIECGAKYFLPNQGVSCVLGI